MRHYPKEVYEVLRAQICPICANFRQSKIKVHYTSNTSYSMVCNTCGGKFTRTFKNLYESLVMLSRNKRAMKSANYYNMPIERAIYILASHTNIEGIDRPIPVNTSTKKKYKVNKELKGYLEDHLLDE